VREEKLTGLTMFEIALYVINMLEEDNGGNVGWADMKTAFTQEKVQQSCAPKSASSEAVEEV